jgi:hypothetical protein
MDFGSGHANVFAVLFPISTSAHESVAQNHNARLSDWANNILPQSHSIIKQYKDSRLFKLPFAALRGRRCFTFGSSRYKDYHLPKSDDISKLHFALFFNPIGGALCIRNASLCGTWISAGSDGCTLMRCADEAALKVSSITISSHQGSETSLSDKSLLK